jgi:hypothetical protein
MKINFEKAENWNKETIIRKLPNNSFKILIDKYFSLNFLMPSGNH